MFAGMNSLKIGRASAAAFVTVSLAVAIASTSASAAGQGKPNGAKAHRAYPAYHGHRVAPAAMLPYGPEYGFLTHLPPNAVRMPGYTFVPGVGILGESCDLPTSACPNEYRDIQQAVAVRPACRLPHSIGNRARFCESIGFCGLHVTRPARSRHFNDDLR
jgi:hypothetical protein